MIRRYLALLVMVIWCSGSAFAQDTQTLRITESFSSEPIARVISSIENKYAIKVFYNPDWVQGVVVSQNADNQSILEFFNPLLESLGLKLEAYDRSNFVMLPTENFSRNATTNNNSTVEATRTIIEVGNASRSTGSVATLSGYVKDGKNGETIIGASIYSLENERGSTTNDQGFFNLELPTGRQRIRVSFIGYADDVREINLRSDGSIDFELYEGLVNLQSVTVTGEAPDQNVRSLDMGVEKLNIATIKKLPRLLGEADVVKSLVLLPGITTVGEGASGYNVRGGSVGENLILQDGAEVFNSSHLFGFFSAFNPDLVRGISLYKGGSVPANLGGRLSSILDVQLREGNYKKIEGNGGIGLLTSRLAIEGPIIKDKTSFLAGGRVSYSDWLLSTVDDIDLKQSSASFYDANIKISHEIGPNDKLFMAAYSSQDKFSLASDTTFNYGTDLASLKWNHLFSPQVFLSTTFAVGSYGYEVTDEQGLNQFQLNSSIDYRSAEAALELDVNDAHKLTLGVKGTLYENHQGDFVPAEGSFNLVQVNIPKEKAIESAAFISDEWNINNNISLSLGLRYSDWRNIGARDVFVYQEGVPMTTGSIIDTLSFGSGEEIQSYSGFEPRASLRVSLDATSSVKVSYNRMRQYMHLVSNTVAVTPIDVWQMSNQHIRPAISDQYSIGIFKNFADNSIETSLEYYRKETNDVLDFKGGANLLLNETLETDLLQGEGKAWGVEFLIKKKEGILTGWLSYTYSRTKLRAVSPFPGETVNRGEFYAANYDKPHDLTIVAEYKLGRRVSVNTNFTYSTGRPITAPTSSYSIGQLRSLADYSRRNQFRIPDYHRLDISLTVGRGFKKARKYKSEWNFAIYNVYGRRNAYSIFFDESSNANQLSILGLFPSISYNFTF